MRWFIFWIWIVLGGLRIGASEFLLKIQTITELFDGRRSQIELPIRNGSSGMTTLTFSLQENNFLPTVFTRPIRTLYGRSAEDPASVASVVVTPDSIAAQIFHRSGADYLRSTFVEPGFVRLAFEQSTSRVQSSFQCLAAPAEERMALQATAAYSKQSAHLLREFRLAAAATAEFTAYFGSKEAAIEQLVIALSRASTIFFKEIGVSFQLVPGFEQMVFTDPAADPYTSNEPTEQLLDQAQDAFDSIIGTENYDLGVVLTRGAYGLTYYRSVCDPLRKGKNCVGLPDPVGDAFHVGIVTHEIAHQFGASHTFNSPEGFCAERRNGFTAYEPGAGSTIMSYSSLPCGGDSFQATHDSYFHSENLKEMRAFLESGAASCARTLPGGNSPPAVQAGSQYIIPIGTPFALTASGHDPDGDDISFCWEQRDLGPAQPLGAPDNGFGPLFRSFPPSYSPTRVFPALEYILAGTDAPEERLPQTNRLMRFRVTARDSHDHGSFSWADTQLVVTNAAGPFRITSHTTPQELLRGSTRILWNPAGTELPPISATHLRITLSTNGGLSFPIVLAESTPNDGSEEVRLPDINSENVRLKIEPSNNIFFDINHAPLRLGSTTMLRLNVTGRAGDFRLSWPSQSGLSYRVERSVQLSPARWSELLRTNATVAEISIPLPASEAAAYYRLLQE